MQQKRMSDLPPNLDLDSRSGLPEPLRKLLEEYPRDLWEQHSNFEGLIRFWLERHAMFRKLVATLQQDIADLEQKKLEADSYKNRMARFGNLFVGELHTHHMIEDQQYFPALQKIDGSLDRGFHILDKDHHRIDDYLEAFTTGANKVLKASGKSTVSEALRFQADMEKLERALERHLVDEEELVVPVVLKYGFEH